jgi:hypothetical protein
MHKAVLMFICVVILIGVGSVFLNYHLKRVYGVGYDPNNSRDLQKLLAIAGDSLPLREALERFKYDRGGYPRKSADLFPSYLRATNTTDELSDWAGWNYHPESTESYVLIYKANWDDGLSYEQLTNNTHTWYYFTSTKVTDLTQKFEQK